MGDKPIAFIGYALTWDVVSRRAVGTQELLPGAFRRALAARIDVRCMFGGELVGSIADGSLALSENAHGLLIELQPWRHTAALAQLAKAAAGMHLAMRFRVRAEAWTAPPFAHRTITEATLSHVIIGARGIRGSWIAPATKASVWRATKANLDRMAEDVDNQLADVEAAC